MFLECVKNSFVMLCLEYCWNKYPSTTFSSSLLKSDTRGDLRDVRVVIESITQISYFNY